MSHTIFENDEQTIRIESSWMGKYRGKVYKLMVNEREFTELTMSDMQELMTVLQLIILSELKEGVNL